ncbi:nuclear transport factor 2 family protein [Frankia tisae]|uniref:nuclear transport factor 2 family protein n=1 Tax=Frankia tisae TaxID=2950104 RepID=UPI0021BF368A|nr:nuclear transport factor 2 family protein [Frankia tisae]
MTGVLPRDDALAIQEILALFAHVFDNNDVAGLGLVFTSDVRVDIGLGPSRTYRGLAEFADYVRSRSAAEPDHHTVNTSLLPQEDGSVRARSRYLGVNLEGRLTSGEFLDVLVCTPRGWRISYRRSVPRTPRPAGTGVPVSQVLEPWLGTSAGRP